MSTRVSALELATSNEVSLALDKLDTARRIAEVYRETLVPQTEQVYARTLEEVNFMLAGAFEALAARAEQAAPAAPPARLALASPTPQAPPFTAWEPDYAPASSTLRQFHAGSPPVGLTVLFYRDVPGGPKLVSSTNRFSQPKSEFRENSADLRDESFAGRHMAVREAMLGVEGRRLLVWQWYWVNGSMTSSNYVGKLLQIKGKLLAGNGDGATVMVFSPYDEDPAAARAASACRCAERGPAAPALRNSVYPPSARPRSLRPTLRRRTA